jgi:hypothetical protein
MRFSLAPRHTKQRFFSLLLLASALASLLTGGCGKATPTDKSILWLDSKHQVTLLDSAATAVALLADSSDSYFERVTLRDMQWQMRATTPDSQRPGLFPASCQLARIRGLAYGPDAYFTRGDVIFIAPGVLATNDPDQLADILVHEVWHLISRASLYKAGLAGPDSYFPKPSSLRDKTYAAVGFTRLQGRLSLPAADSAELVLNPDATFNDWAIPLQAAGDTALRHYLPLLRLSATTQETGPERSIANAVGIAYCPLSPTQAGWQTSLAEARDLSSDPAFLFRTGGNTPYILHPEEIVAENMLLLARGEQASAGTQGQVVLDSLRNVLWQWVKYEKQLSRRR